MFKQAELGMSITSVGMIPDLRIGSSRNYVTLRTTPHPDTHTHSSLPNVLDHSPVKQPSLAPDFWSPALDLAFRCRGLSHHHLARMPTVGWAAAPGGKPLIRGWTAVCAEDSRQHG